MRWPPSFLTDMDSRRWRAIVVTLGLFLTVGLIFFFGKTQLGLATEAKFESWLEGFSGSPWGLPVSIVVFTVASLIGAPQFVLIAACVVAFGPLWGFFYSWIATVVSAAANYWLGRLAGARTLERFGGSTMNKLAGIVGKNAFFGSFIIRNVPSAPFIVVNMAFGVSRASFTAFILGCALGVLPKTALVAIFGQSFMTMSRSGDWRAGALIGGIGVAWLAIMLVVRGIVRRRRKRIEEGTA
jgi:uncharacterized membrane protein YdjX (TVP38/TMEM64 family)